MDLNLNANAIKLFKENREANLYDLDFHNGFLNMSEMTSDNKNR